MTYLFGVTKHIKCVIPVMYTLSKMKFLQNFPNLGQTYFSRS